MRIFVLVFFLAVFICAGTYDKAKSQDQSTTLTKEVDMREGPGSYFDLILRLNRGLNISKVKKESGWINVNVDRYDGWIPDHSQLFEETIHQQEMEDNFRERMRAIYSQMSDEEKDSSSAYASPTQVAAVVRGFARQYSENRKASLRYDFSQNFGKKINSETYVKFKQDRVGNWNLETAENYFELSEVNAPEYNPNVDPLGWAVASLLAEDGLVDNTELQSYLQNLTNLAVESSHRVEIPIQIHLLDQREIAGYSTPNGIIFITKGALQTMESEAELLFFIAHEVAHVVMQHGVQEVGNREIRIRRDDAFSELEQELNDEDRDEEYTRISQELSAWADKVYQYLVQDRLEEYEFESDFLGLIYVYRLGYNPSAALDFLRRIQAEESEMESSIGKLEWEGVTLENREENLVEAIQKLQSNSQHPGYEYQNKFKDMMRNLE